MESEQLVWIVAYLLFLVFGGMTMLGVYLIFGKRNSNQRRDVLGERPNEFRARQKAMEALEKRYAKGEIDHEQYEKERRELYKDSRFENKFVQK
ncbi:hypothetical protein GWO43_07060 [candidate division KSB1 bacterium]|nr:hypothetical protein [candidate division KSB1 bacterium]NIR72767.1 hypothetical protein [candidate division KSB1 bacterium]NIS23723.1 hypothetical protein [candidate division KSB1 bacterium]NIT70643.1 hypothetical protein [candidate division KSB1 bacterium]NIU24371.1 hypothetical protein [candidate division KSB1 bacterium]